MQIPAIGRVVHYKPDSTDKFKSERPAMIVYVWNAPGSPAEQDTACQLQVFTDSDAEGLYNDKSPPLLWKTSRLQGDQPGQYHFHEDCQEQ